MLHCKWAGYPSFWPWSESLSPPLPGVRWASSSLSSLIASFLHHVYPPHSCLFSSHATFSALSRPKPFTVCCILSSQRGRKTLLFFCNSAKSIFWGRAVLAMCAGSSGWVGSLALHWYFICPTTSRNAACTKQCHSFKYFHSYHLQTSVYLVLQCGTSNR